MAIEIHDGMSAVQFKNEIETKALDKTSDNLDKYISVPEKPIGQYADTDIIPFSFLQSSVDSLTLFLVAHYLSGEMSCSDILDTAFGKNCADRVYNIGAQLWNFHTVIGDTATSVPTGDGETLANCKTLAEIKASALAMNQLANFPAMRELIVASPYAKQQLGVTWTS